MAAADFDGDGHTDILLGGDRPGDGVSLLLGNGEGELSSPTAVFQPAPDEAGALTSIEPVDIDGDADLDVYLVRRGANVLLRNDPPGRFSPWSAGDRSPLGLEDEGLGSCAAFQRDSSV
jgi:hypothetical protein